MSRVVSTVMVSGCRPGIFTCEGTCLTTPSSTLLRTIMLRQFNLKSSGKDIPISSRTNYIKKLISQTESFLKNMRWKMFWYERNGPNSNNDNDMDQPREIMMDFKSTKTPPQHELLKPFERDIYNLIGNIEFRKINDPGLRKLNVEVKKINNIDKIIVNVDKNGNKYKISASN